MVKKLKWNLILMSLLYVGLGIFLVMKPGTALNIVCYALGGVVLACAAVQLIRYFVVERGVFQSQLTLVSGIVCLALGAFLIIRSDIVVSILPIVFGLFVIFDAIGRVQNALDLRRCGYDSWKGFLFLPVLWWCSAFYRGCYEIRVISYVSHGSLLQHLPTISSYLFTCLLSEASLWSMKSAIQIDRIIIIIRLLPTDAHIAVFLCDGH